jgi:hypothetical protein
MNVNNKNTQTIITAGGLGDMLIVLCKLHSEHVRNNTTFRIIRYDLFSQYEHMIENLFDSASFAEYISPSQIFKDIDTLNSAISKAAYPYVDTKWQKTHQETYSFDYTTLNPFPNFNMGNPAIDKSKTNIGIQLFCGLDAHNFRGFGIEWLRKLRSRFPKEEFNLWLFGESTGMYDFAELESLCLSENMRNMVNKLSFKEWMKYFGAMNFFISINGFSAFYALSQKVPTLLYNQCPYLIDNSLHPLWVKNSTVINLNMNKVVRKLRRIFKRNKFYSPAIPNNFAKGGCSCLKL